MRRYAWVALILIAVSLGASVRALPTHEVTHIYYDCAMKRFYGAPPSPAAVAWDLQPVQNP